MKKILTCANMALERKMALTQGNLYKKFLTSFLNCKHLQCWYLVVDIIGRNCKVRSQNVNQVKALGMYIQSNV